MAFNLYCRHGSNCGGGRALTSESDELRRNRKRCSCPIYASGCRRLPRMTQVCFQRMLQAVGS
jgi:hypothetical protein